MLCYFMVSSGIDNTLCVHYKCCLFLYKAVDLDWVDPDSHSGPTFENKQDPDSVPTCKPCPDPTYFKNPNPTMIRPEADSQPCFIIIVKFRISSSLNMKKKVIYCPWNV